MKTPDDFGVKSVYSYKSSQDLKNYYNDWAKEYDKYTQDVNYILAHHVAKVASDFMPDETVTVLDIGCGTGIVGEKLFTHKPKSLIDGVDLSIEMINIAKLKIGYNNFYCQDLTLENKYIKEKYDFIISAGTFTLGHLGAKQLVESIDYLKINGQAIFSVKGDHYENEKFYITLQLCVEKKVIKNLEIKEINSYNSNYKALSKMITFTKI
ncbi:MAG: class I SAM-dependent methyltransferase [Proteobacteria bacterium]|nr:class I SAM-dependent methyltransferase [Pseudomonadota bacterium]